MRDDLAHLIALTIDRSDWIISGISRGKRPYSQVPFSNGELLMMMTMMMMLLLLMMMIRQLGMPYCMELLQQITLLGSGRILQIVLDTLLY